MKSINGIIRHIGLLSFLILLYGCSSCRDLSGTYLSSLDFERNKIILTNERFHIIDKYSERSVTGYLCCDTISYGTWEKLKALPFIELSSPDYLNESHVDNIVLSSYNASLGDSIEIKISNPIEDFFDETGLRLELTYKVFPILTVDSDPTLYFEEKLSNIEWQTNTIKFNLPKNVKIKTFIIMAYPKHEMQLHRLDRQEFIFNRHDILNLRNNTFLVKAPNFDFTYLTLLRLKKNYIKIENNSLLWNGVLYSKVKAK